MMMASFCCVMLGKSISWYNRLGDGGDDWFLSRKKRVSEPAPREMICLVVCEGKEVRKRETRRSIAVVRTYVPDGSGQQDTQARSLAVEAIPRLMMGNLLCTLWLATKYLAKGSSRYPTCTALSRETLASPSVACTILSLTCCFSSEMTSSSWPGLPRPLPRPMPDPRALREFKRLGM